MVKKIKMDLGEVKIPQVVLNRLGPLPDKKDNETIQDHIRENLWELLYQEQGHIISKEEAKFWIEFHDKDMPAEGGYPIFEEISFVEGSVNYIICVFGHGSESYQNYARLFHVIYKEPLTSD